MTSPYALPEWAALLAAVRANPADDLPRLVAADWLEERGQHERAEFVRVQVERPQAPWCPYRPASGCGCRRCGLARREAELIAEHGRSWFAPAAGWSVSAVSVTRSESPGVLVGRGFVSFVHCGLSQWAGDECEACAGTGQDTTGDGWPCPVCDGSGTRPGVGPAVVAAHSVERVALTDREPTDGICRDEWTWVDDVCYAAPQFAAAVLPYGILETMIGLFPGAVRYSLDERYAAFTEHNDAVLALSATLLAWAHARHPAPAAA